ncbi:hypothetical protein BGZ93_011278 [Podila epicladia]|nr:hypothetical protein BGZ93_011278 [Podila epicladia]
MHSTTIIIIAVASVGVLSIILCCCMLAKDRIADQDQLDRWKRILGSDGDDLESGRTSSATKKPASGSKLPSERRPEPETMEPNSMQ